MGFVAQKMAVTGKDPASPTKAIFFGMGVLCVGLGGIGLLLPVLPTTPFLLLAAACFARSSPRAHARLLNNKVFGPTIREWQISRSIPGRTKALAITVMSVMVAFSLILTSASFLVQAFLVICWAGVTIYLLRVPSTPPK